MNSEERKRVTVKLKCPNPLFEEWLIGWKQQAVAKVVESKVQHIYNHALQSLRKYPLPLQSGKDCKILKGFGDRLCKMLDEKLKEYKNRQFTVNTVNNPLHMVNVIVEETAVRNSKKKTSNTTQKTGVRTKDYIPQYGSGSYAILVTLYQKSFGAHYPGFLYKTQIIEHGKHLVNSSFTKPDLGSRYTAWSSIRTLLSKNLVCKSSHPPKFSLTEEGKILAKKLYESSDETDNNKDSDRDFDGIQICQKNLENNQHLQKYTPEEFILPNFTEGHKNISGANITNNCRTYDLDIQDDFADDLLRNNWIPENDTFSIDANSDNNRNTDDYNIVANNYYTSNNVRNDLQENNGESNQFLESLINSVEYVATSKQANSKVPLDRFISGESLSSKNGSCESEPIFSRADGKKSFQKFYSTDSISSSKKSPVNMPIKSKEKTLKRLTSASSVTSTTSKISIVENFVMPSNSFDIILCIDNNETSGSSNSQNDEILVNLTKQGIGHEVRDLKVGDFLWICRDRITKKELVLPYIIERKRMDDLAHSIKDKRYHEQKFRLKKSGIENLIYLIESHGKNQYLGLPLQSLYQAASNTAIQENFFIKFTENTKETVDYLVNFSRILVKMFKSKTLASCSKDALGPVDINDDVTSLITFKELNESSVKNKRMKVTELFIKMLIQIKGMSVERALVVTQLYPTPIVLKRAYEDNSSSQGEKLLSGIKYGRYGKCLGLVLSKTVYQAFNKTLY